VLHGVPFDCQNFGEGRSQGTSIAVVPRRIEQVGQQPHQRRQRTPVLWTDLREKFAKILLKVARKHGIKLALNELQSAGFYHRAHMFLPRICHKGFERDK
jgi:hypothetical protein